MNAWLNAHAKDLYGFLGSVAVVCIILVAVGAVVEAVVNKLGSRADRGQWRHLSSVHRAKQQMASDDIR